MHRFFHALIYKDESYVRSCDTLSYEETTELMGSYADGNRRLTEKYYRDPSAPLFPELTKGEPLVVWNVDSEEFFKLTVDVLEVIVQFAATSGMSVDASAPVRRADQDGDPATVGDSNDRSVRALRKAARLIKRGGGQRTNGKDPTSPA